MAKEKEKKVRQKINWKKEMKLAPGYIVIILWVIFTFMLLGWIPVSYTHLDVYKRQVVVSAKIEDDERAQVIEKVKALVERFGGQISDVDEWGKKRLAYEIQKMKEAYYYFIHFESDAETPSEIEQRIRIMDNVIRFLCVRQDA